MWPFGQESQAEGWQVQRPWGEALLGVAEELQEVRSSGE